MTDIEKCNLILQRMADAGYPDFYLSVDDSWSLDDIEYFLANYEERYITNYKPQ